MSVLPGERDLVIGWPRERVDYLLTVVEVAGRRLSSANEGSEKLLLLSARTPHLHHGSGQTSRCLDVGGKHLDRGVSPAGLRIPGHSAVLTAT